MTINHETYDGESVTTVTLRLPMKVRAVVVIADDGHPTVLINEALSPERQRIEAMHEWDHYTHGDAFSAESIRDIERRAAAIAAHVA